MQPQLRNHRFRTQLATVVSSAELLQLYSAHFSEAERRDLVNEIRAAAHRMREMLDEVAAAQPASTCATNEACHG